MNKERFILSFVAIIVGLLVAGGVFYLYQMTKTVSPNQNSKISIKGPSPTPDSSAFTFIIDSPSDEEVVDRKTITVSGHTLPNVTIIASTENEDQIATPTQNGDFTFTQTIGDGTNIVSYTAIFPGGDEKKITRTITYSTESF